MMNVKYQAPDSMGQGYCFAPWQLESKLVSYPEGKSAGEQTLCPAINGGSSGLAIRLMTSTVSRQVAVGSTFATLCWSMKTGE